MNVHGNAFVQMMFMILEVILHLGKSADVGHYVCEVRAPGGWLRYDDSKVTEVGINRLAVRSPLSNSYEELPCVCMRVP